MTLWVVAIVGPTASGKTRLAVEVAHRIGSEIISADSRQVYRGLDLGTGKDLHEYAAVRPPVAHHLIDIVDPSDIYTVFDYQRDCFEVLRRRGADTRYRSGSVPLLMVGGSGLYLEAVIRGYRIADVPEDPDLRRRLSARPYEELVARLAAEDPALAARTDLSSRKRVVRALEIVAHGGSGSVRFSEPLGIEVRYTVIGVRVDRGELRRRIDERVDRRMERGMVDEVRGLLRRGVPPERLEMLGLEYREIGAYLRGDRSRADMVSRLKRRIGQLAKRQHTYFRGVERRGVPIRWVDAGDAEAVIDVIASCRAAG